MPNEDIITFQLDQINTRLVEIKKELSSGHTRMDDHSRRLLILEISRKNNIKTVGAVWAISILALGAFMNSYFQSIYLKPKTPVAPVRAETTKTGD